MRIPHALFVALIVLFGWSAGAGAAEFAPCKDAGDFPELKPSLCRVFQEPLRAPGAATGGAPDSVSLFVRKFPSLGRAKGTFWLVAGGPGESGASFYPFLDTLRAAFPGFDLLIPDHRGTGYSTRLCPKEEAIGTPGDMALAGAEWETCWQSLNAAPDYARAFSITNAAYDLADLMARYRGAAPAYVYGVSYGTQLVLRSFQVAHPDVRGVMLDSLVPPEESAQWDLSHRSQIADDVGRAVLRACDADPSCRAQFPAGAAEAYGKLLAAPDMAIRSQIPGKDLKVLFGGLLDFPGVRARIPALIAELNRGDTTTLSGVKTDLARIGNVFERYPQAPSSIPLVSIISVSENDARPQMSKADVAAEQSQMLFASTLPGLLLNPGLPLYTRDIFFGRAPKKLPRTLVLQGGLDPKTPLAGAQAHVAQLRKSGPVTLITVAGAPHFVLMTSPDCFVQAAHALRAGGSAADCAAPHFREDF